MEPTVVFDRFRDVTIGERFRFLYNPYVAPRLSTQAFTKVHARWFTDAQGRRYTTGATTAVQREADHAVR